MKGTNRFNTIGSFKDFSERGKETDFYSPLLNNYTDRVKNEIVNQLQEHKKMSKNDAQDFLDNLFSLGDSRLKQIKDVIRNNYSKDNNIKKCASEIIENFYKITKVSKYDDPYTHEEITEVSESLLDKLKRFN